MWWSLICIFVVNIVCIIFVSSWCIKIIHTTQCLLHIFLYTVKDHLRVLITIVFMMTNLYSYIFKNWTDSLLYLYIHLQFFLLQHVNQNLTTLAINYLCFRQMYISKLLLYADWRKENHNMIIFHSLTTKCTSKMENCIINYLWFSLVFIAYLHLKGKRTLNYY